MESKAQRKATAAYRKKNVKQAHGIALPRRRRYNQMARNHERERGQGGLHTPHRQRRHRQEFVGFPLCFYSIGAIL